MDVAAQVNAVRRSIEQTVRSGRPARVLVVERELDGPVERVWQAVSDPDQLQRWFLKVRGDERRDYALYEGGPYELAGNASGVILTCEAPSRLLLTWEFGGDTSWVEVHLTPSEQDAGRSVLTLVQTASVDERSWAQFGPGAVGVGWDLALLALARYLQGRLLGESWAGSDIGHSFISAASLAWGKASILAGTPLDDAAAAVQRTTAAYTGRPAPDQDEEPTP